MQDKYYTKKQAAEKIGCSLVNVYQLLKKGKLETVQKTIFVKHEGQFISIRKEEFITSESIKAAIDWPRTRRKGKRIRAKYVDPERRFENGQNEIIFSSETIAAERLGVSKFKIRYWLNKEEAINGFFFSTV